MIHFFYENIEENIELGNDFNYYRGNVYTKNKIELNEFIRRNYPQWNCKAI